MDGILLREDIKYVCVCVCGGGGFLLNQPNRILAEGGLRLIHQRQELMNVIRSGK